MLFAVQKLEAGTSHHISCKVTHDSISVNLFFYESYTQRQLLLHHPNSTPILLLHALYNIFCNGVHQQAAAGARISCCRKFLEPMLNIYRRHPLHWFHRVTCTYISEPG
uniref:Uncharacterized protein n=1 Tax=Arundo donax TaxID=35708 RepID=A0A0A9CUC4_ARUDO